VKPTFSGRFFFFAGRDTWLESPEATGDITLAFHHERRAKVTPRRVSRLRPSRKSRIMAEQKKTEQESKPEPQQSGRKISKGGGYTIPVQMF
jgi:hypothetical protein